MLLGTQIASRERKDKNGDRRREWGAKCLGCWEMRECLSPNKEKLIYRMKGVRVL